MSNFENNSFLDGMMDSGQLYILYHCDKELIRVDFGDFDLISKVIIL